MAALKEIYSPAFYHTFADAVEIILPSFNRKKFINLIYDKNWKQKELKQRVRHTTIVLHQFLPNNFNEAAKILIKVSTELEQKSITENIFGFMFLPDYIETYGLNDYENSVQAIEIITQFVSCEYAVRPFIIKYQNMMMKQMLKWSKHKNHHVRRLASEGSRPRLPWAIALPEFKKNPSLILPILENLKSDDSEYVRRSVANNLNDIAKDNPDIVIALAKKWIGSSKETDAIIKHACRTLLKQAHPEVLKLYLLNDNKNIQMNELIIHTSKVNIGSNLNFSFSIVNHDNIKQQIRIEYGIYYLRQNGQHSKKVFKISERALKPKEEIQINKSHSFRRITTRRFYIGFQKLAIIINGIEKTISTFELIE